MTELEALRRVAEAARAHVNSAIDNNSDVHPVGWAELYRAVRALDALPAPATPARSRLAALEALHAVVRDYETGNGKDVRWSDVRAALAAVDHSPAPAAEPEGEVVVCYVSRSDGSATWVLPGSMAGVMIARSENWRRVGEMRVPLPRVPEVVGEGG